MESPTLTLEQLQHQLSVTQAQYLELKTYTQELERKHKQIQDFVQRDELTGLYSRPYLFEYLSHLQTTSQSVSIALLDIDRFRNINETFSRAIGDEALKGVAALLSRFSRQTDAVIRFNIEKFVVVFPDTDLQAALVACERFRYNIQYHNWTLVHPKLQVSLSIGIASGKTTDYEQLLTKANENLNASKREGKNRIQY